MLEAKHCRNHEKKFSGQQQEAEGGMLQVVEMIQMKNEEEELLLHLQGKCGSVLEGWRDRERLVEQEWERFQC